MNDVPGTYRWTLTLSNGGQPLIDRFNVTYSTPALEAPVTYGQVQPHYPTGVTWGVVIGDMTPVLIDMSVADSIGTVPITSPENATSQQLQAAASYWEYAVLSSNVYRDGRETTDIEGLEKVGDSVSFFSDINYQIETNAQSTDAYLAPDDRGFYAETFVRMEGNKIVEVIVVFRGTENAKDWLNGNITPAQERIARNYAAAVAKDYSGFKITLTGHSLGGALAKVAADEVGGTAIVFNSSPRGPESSSVISMQEAGDPLNPFQGSDVIYNFGTGNAKSEHSIFNLAAGMRKLIGK